MKINNNNNNEEIMMKKLIIKTYKDRYGRNRRAIQFKNKAMYHLGFTLRKAFGRGCFKRHRFLFK